MDDWTARRLADLPPYLFVEIDRRKRQALAEGRDVIDFGIGDPDRPTPEFIVDRLAQAARDPAHHRYPAEAGLPRLRRGAARFFRRRFGVALDPDHQILTLIGSKEGLGHLPLAVVDPGDTVIVPQPGYPVYHAAALFAGARIQPIPLAADRDWLPDLANIPSKFHTSARMMFLNYPNNPTAATAPLAFFEEAVAFARRHRILIAQDAAYSEVYFDEPPPSILQVDGADEVAVEFHSLSKTFNMTGWRLAFAVGNASAIAALAKVKSNVDSGQFGAIQEAACAALESPDHEVVSRTIDTYRRRREILVTGLRELGVSVAMPKATFFVWARCPAGYTSMEFATKLLGEAAVVVVPGVGFGPAGEGYFRLALTVTADRIQEALERIRRVIR
jgi:LL-diaminopimelate aminotransferase